MNYKKISKISFVALMALAIIFPSISMAMTPEEKAQREEQRSENQADREAQRTEKTCTQLSAKAEQIQARLAERISNLAQKRTEMEEKINQKLADRLAKLAEKRASIDETKALNWEKLRANAKTDEQKAAVEKFITAVQSAVKTKRDAIDKIISDFRASLLAERTERKTENDAALTTYKNAVDSLVSQVKDDCAAGKDAKTIRENFRTGIKNARDAFRANRKTVEKFRADITPIKEAKKAELKAVIDTFQASIESAKSELRSAFPKATETTATESE